jgi:hypothetical protein
MSIRSIVAVLIAFFAIACPLFADLGSARALPVHA